MLLASLRSACVASRTYCCWASMSRPEVCTCSTRSARNSLAFLSQPLERRRRSAQKYLSWHVREGGGAMALMPWCYAARNGPVRLVSRVPVGMGAPSDTAALGDRGMGVLERSCSAADEGRWCRSAWALRATLQRSATAEWAFWSVLAALLTRVDGAYQLACARGRWCHRLHMSGAVGGTALRDGRGASLSTRLLLLPCTSTVEGHA